MKSDGMVPQEMGSVSYFNHNDAESLYQRSRQILLSNREKAVEKLTAARKDYEKLQHSIVPRKAVKLRHAKNAVSLCENSLSLIDSKLKYLRPRRDEDVAYRNRQHDAFSDRIKQLLPEEIPLRFHGCPIYAAENIIASGEISSSVDRLGVETSYDGAGQISVTTRDDLYITVQSYSDLSYDYNLPAGCVFVLTPESLADEACGKQLLMGNVNFKDDPQRLVAVISTPENIPLIRSWLKETGQSSDKAVDYDGFVNSIDKFLHSVRIPYREISALRSPESTERKPSVDAMIQSAVSRSLDVGNSNLKKARDVTDRGL